MEIIHNTQIERKIVSIFYYHDGLTTTIMHLAKRNNMLFTFYSTVLHTVGLWDQSTNLEESRRRTAGNTGHRTLTGGTPIPVSNPTQRSRAAEGN